MQANYYYSMLNEEEGKEGGNRLVGERGNGIPGRGFKV